jgi:hypothetical protein
MLPFCLYFVAGVITGLHVYTLLALAVYGVPFNPLELVALSGSLCLLIAAYVSLFKPYAAARLALLASLAIWCFYGPAIAKSIRTKHDKPSSVLHDQALFPTHGLFSSPGVTESAGGYEGGFISLRRFGPD